MPTLYSHEIESYRQELKKIEQQFSEATKEKNLTHASFAVSNRANLFVVGLCSLVEARLYDLALSVNNGPKFSDFKTKMKGISRLIFYLKSTNTIVFSELSNWDAFQSVYKIRNSIIHSYGGMITDENLNILNKYMEKLKLEDFLVGKRRIRLNPKALKKILNIIDSLLNELDAYVI